MKTTTFSVRYDAEHLQLLKNIGKSPSALSQKALDRELHHHLLTEGCNLTPKEMIALQRRIRTRLTALQQEYEKESGELFAELARVTTLRAMSAADLDTGKLQIAQSLLEVRGFYHDGPAQKRTVRSDQAQVTDLTPIRKELVEDLLDELASNDGARLFTYYYGVKNYANFGDQRCDCQYHLGPDHGEIVFRIGLTDEARGKKKFTHKQIDAMIYFLEQMLRKRVCVEKGLDASTV